MADTSREEVIQRLQTLLENNARVTVEEKSSAEGVTVRSGNVEFVIPRTAPSVITRSTGRYR